MNVITRKNEISDLDVREIKRMTKYATNGLKTITAEEIEVAAKISFIDGMSTRDIQQSLIAAAVGKIDIDNADASVAAARLYLYDMYHEYKSKMGNFSFKTYLEVGVSEGRLNPVLLEFDIAKVESLLDFSDGHIFDKDYIFSYAAIKNFATKVLKRDRDGVLAELPQFAMLANSMIQCYHEKNRMLRIEELYKNVLSEQIAMTATPTLGNARSARPQLSSCYIGATPDNIEGINESHEYMSLLSKFGGGIGWDWHDVRAALAPVDNVKGASGGIGPFLKITNGVGVAVDQLGCTDKDARVIVIESISINGEVTDLSKSFGAIHKEDEVESVASYVGELAYLMDVEDKNLASLALSCLYVFPRKWNESKKDHFQRSYDIAHNLYGISELEWESYIIQMESLVNKHDVVPIGFSRTSICNSILVSISGTVVDRDTLVVLDTTASGDKFGTALIDNNEYLVSEFVSDAYSQKEILNHAKMLTVARLLNNGINECLESGMCDDVRIGTKNIANVEPGNFVMSLSDKGTLIGSPVIASMSVIVKKELQTTIVTDIGKFHTSLKHPIPVVSSVCKHHTNDYEWIPAGKVNVGDNIVIANAGIQSCATIKEITNEKKDELFRDLTIKNTNSYFIYGDEDGSHLIHNTRKGAIAVYLEPWHMSVEDVLNGKKPATEERLSTPDLYPALWMNDLFYERANDNANWTLLDPYDCSDLHGLYGEEFKVRYEAYEKDPRVRKKTIRAQALFAEILKLYAETGSPFLVSKDESNRRHMCENIGVIRSSNLCVEILNATSPGELYTTVIFTDGSELELKSSDLITTDAGFKKYPTRLNSFDYLHSKQVRMVTNVNKNAKVAVCNLSSINLSKYYKLSADERRQVVRTMVRANDNIIDINFYPIEPAMRTNSESRSIGLGVMGEHHMLALLGIQYGSQEHFEYIDELYEELSYYAIEASADLAQEKGSYPAFDGSKWANGDLPYDTANELAKSITSFKPKMDWEGLREKTRAGMRNGYILAIAPTSTISVHTSTTSSVEPIYKRAFVEKNLAGMTRVIAPDLSAATWNFYEGAYEKDQTLLVKAAAVRQKWIDQSQSLNIFNKIGAMTGRQMFDMYYLGNKLGVKSFYYLRSQSPEALADEVVLNKPFECESCQ